MTDRNELIEAGAQALYPMTGRTDPRHVGDYEHTTAAGVVDAVEGLIRADEQEQIDRAHRRTAQWAREKALADLRAQVLVLGGPMGLLPTEDVLALIDGSST